MFHEITAAGIHSVLNFAQEKGYLGWVAILGGIGDGKTKVATHLIDAWQQHNEMKVKVNRLDMIEMLGGIQSNFGGKDADVLLIENYNALNIMIATPHAPEECRITATNIYHKLKRMKEKEGLSVIVESETRAGICLTRELFDHVITIPRNTGNIYRREMGKIIREYDLKVENQDLYATLTDRIPSFVSIREFHNLVRPLAEANRGKSAEKVVRLLNEAASL